MAKYYVSSGSLNRVIGRDTHREAARDAIRDHIITGGRIDEYGDITEVSETGFSFKPDEGMFFSTEKLLTEIGVL